MATFTTTTKWALRWLTGTNLVSDIDAGFQALAEDIDPKLTPYDTGARSARPQSTAGTPGKAGRMYRSADGGVDMDFGTGWITVTRGLFTALPTLSGHAGDGLDEGMEILYQTAAMVTAGVGSWTLRYDSSLSGTSKWAATAATPWVVRDTPGSNVDLTVAGAFTDFSDAAPTIALPAAGSYVVRIGATAVSNAAARYVDITPVATGLAASANNAMKLKQDASLAGEGNIASVSSEMRADGISGTLKMQYYTSGSGDGNDVFVSRRTLSVVPIRIG